VKPSSTAAKIISLGSPPWVAEGISRKWKSWNRLALVRVRMGDMSLVYRSIVVVERIANDCPDGEKRTHSPSAAAKKNGQSR
jgi:hypothetical protein